MRRKRRSRRFAPFRALHVSDRWDIYRYALSALWAVAFATFTPSALLPVLTPATTYLTMGAIFSGAIVAIVGRLRNEHLWLELGGAGGMTLGWGFYLLLNAILVFAASPERLGQFVLVLLAMSFSLERLRVLVPRLVQALHEPDGDQEGQA